MNRISVFVAKLSLVVVSLAVVVVAQAAPTIVQRTIPGSSPNTPLAQSQDSDTVKTIGALRKQAAGGGTTRIIVGVRVPFAAEGMLSASEATLQRDEIATAQASVLDKIPAFKQKSKTAKRFESIPFMALEVTAAELEVLLASTDITTIEEDRPNQLHLAGSVPIIGGTSAWSSGYTGAGQTVAILDTGVDKNHPFLTGRVVSEACYSTEISAEGVYSLCPGGAATSIAADSALPYGTICVSGKCDHGTHVAGTAAGSGASAGQSFSGVAKDASIIAIQVFSRVDNSDSSHCNGSAQCVLAYTSDMIAGLQRVYALRNSYSIASVNMSIGGGNYSSQATCDANNASRKAIIDTLRSVNIATVISSGNNGYTSSMGAPGCISSAVSVGSTWDASSSGTSFAACGPDYGGVDKVACYSNSTSFLNLLAPGSAIYASIPNSTYATFHGTSMAAPHVAGAWALLKQANPSLTVTQALTALTNTGQSITDARNGIFKPRINVNAALASIGAPSVPSAPLIGTAVPGDAAVSVAFTPGYIGGGSLIAYWAACSKDGTNWVYGSGSSSPVSVTGLTNGYAYQCYVQTQSSVGYGPWSGASNSVTPIAPLISQVINFTNPGTRTLGNAPFSLSATGGASGNPVTFVSQTTAVCTVGSSTVTLVSAGTCTIAANQAGNASYSAAPQVTQSFTVSPAAAPGVSLSPTSLTFTSQVVGTTSTAKTVTLTNTGGAALTISSISSNNGVYGVTNSCGSGLTAAASCTLSVTYSPTTAVSTLSSISVSSNAAGSPHSVAVNGTGVPAGAPVCTLTANPASVVKNGTVVLAAVCTNSPTSYSWTGGTCAGTATANCTANPTTTTTYGVSGTNSIGTGSASAQVTVNAFDITPILLLLLD